MFYMFKFSYNTYFITSLMYYIKFLKLNYNYA